MWFRGKGEVSPRLERLVADFHRQYGAPPQMVVRAPGRVAIIGGHTDYNHGFVLGCAIDLDVLIAASTVRGDCATVFSSNFNQNTIIKLSRVERSESAPWSDYMRGVIDQMIRSGKRVPGMQMVMDGNVPVGAGLSSSAAVEVATALTITQLAGVRMPRTEMALLCQRAENHFVGVKSGVMDQFMSLMGRAGHAVLLDCRSLSHSYVRMPRGVTLVVADTGKRRSLTSGAYNNRRGECERAVEILRRELPEVTHLRDVTAEDLERRRDELPAELFRRASHVVGENRRVKEFVEALGRRSLQKCGELLNSSHASSRDLFESSTAELDALREAAIMSPGCLGSRLTGAGFGGCTVSLVQTESLDEFQAEVSDIYRQKTGKSPEMWALTASAGAARVPKAGYAG